MPIVQRMLKAQSKRFNASYLHFSTHNLLNKARHVVGCDAYRKVPVGRYWSQHFRCLADLFICKRRMRCGRRLADRLEGILHDRGVGF